METQFLYDIDMNLKVIEGHIKIFVSLIPFLFMSNLKKNTFDEENYYLIYHFNYNFYHKGH